MDGDWTHYKTRPAPHGILCEFKRDEWAESVVCRPEDFHPMANAWGLYWRLTGIGKHELESLPQAARDQLCFAGYNTGFLGGVLAAYIGGTT